MQKAADATLEVAKLGVILGHLVLVWARIRVDGGVRRSSENFPIATNHVVNEKPLRQQSPNLQSMPTFCNISWAVKSIFRTLNSPPQSITMEMLSALYRFCIRIHFEAVVVLCTVSFVL